MLAQSITALLIVQSVFFNGICHGWRDVIRPKHEQKKAEETPKPWLRTIYGTQREIVTPTVIAGVTFSARPAPTPDPMTPWISLKPEGVPVTIKPKIKAGRTVNGPPDYSTYFQTMSTKTYSYEELQVSGMDPDGIHEEEIAIPEDDTYVSLNPLIRCTPKRYFKKGASKDISSEPFCTPAEKKEWKMGQTYFVSWYTRFFQDRDSDATIDQVRIHLFYVRDKISGNGAFRKRDLDSAFYSTEWIQNTLGIHPITVKEEWLGDKYRVPILLSIQPKDISDEEFDPMEHGVTLSLIRGPKVMKKNKHKALDLNGLPHLEWYYVVLTIPAVALLVAVIIYFFIAANGGNRDFSSIKNAALAKRRRVLGKFKDMKRYKNMKNHKYNELPLHNSKTSKQN